MRETNRYCAENRKYHTEAARKRANRDRMRAVRKRKKRLIHFKSQSVEWSTPQATFDGLNGRFHFDLDVCATADNAKCPKYFTKEQDGLKQRWEGVVWCNPPYGRAIERWVQKAFESSLWGTLMVCLLPARTDTQWWHRYVEPLPREDLDKLPGRQRFSGKDSAAFGSAVAIFRPPIDPRAIPL